MAQIEIEQSWLSACRLSNRLDISLNKSEFFIHCRQAAVILGEKEKERDSEKETKGYCKSFFLTVESCFVQRREDNDRPERSNAELESIAMTIDIACARSLSLFLSIESDVKDFFPNDLQEIITRIPCQEFSSILSEREHLPVFAWRILRFLAPLQSILDRVFPFFSNCQWHLSRSPITNDNSLPNTYFNACRY